MLFFSYVCIRVAQRATRIHPLSQVWLIAVKKLIQRLLAHDMLDIVQKNPHEDSFLAYPSYHLPTKSKSLGIVGVLHNMLELIGLINNILLSKLA